jgi:hypothetical protein
MELSGHEFDAADDLTRPESCSHELMIQREIGFFLKNMISGVVRWCDVKQCGSL